MSMRSQAGLCDFSEQPIALLLGQFFWFENYGHSFQYSSEPERHFVYIVLDDRVSSVFTNVECLVQGESNSDAVRNAPLPNLFFVHEEDASRALTEAAPVIPKSNAHHVIACWDRLVGAYAVLVL